MRCDLHVHSKHSGRVNLPVLRHLGRESYSEPQQVYEVARRRGMDLVTLSDHDTIDGALRLAARLDCFVSVEVTCELTSRRQLHLGVCGLDERQHIAIQSRRQDPEALFAFLAEQRLPVVVNHLFSALTGERDVEDFPLALAGARLVEAPNGMMPPETNVYAASAASTGRHALIGGSDAHTLASVARAYTVVPGARSREEFLEGLRAGHTLPAGRSGSYARLTADVVRVFAGGYRENAREALHDPGALLRLAGLLLAIPVLPALPLVTAFIHTRELFFARRQHARYERVAQPWTAAAAAVPLASSVAPS